MLHLCIFHSAADNGVQLIQIHENGTLEAWESLADDAGGDLELAGASRAAAFNMSGHAHALVAGTSDNGVQLIRIRVSATMFIVVVVWCCQCIHKLLS